MTQKNFAAVQAERSRSTLRRHKCRACPTCEGLAAAAHPLAIGAVVTVLRVRNGQFVSEGIATVLRTSSEPDTYFVRFNCADSKPRKRVISIEWQASPARWIRLLNQYLEQDADDGIRNSILAGGENP